MLMNRKTRNHGRLDINAHHFFGLGLRGTKVRGDSPWGKLSNACQTPNRSVAGW